MTHQCIFFVRFHDLFYVIPSAPCSWIELVMRCWWKGVNSILVCANSSGRSPSSSSLSMNYFEKSSNLSMVLTRFQKCCQGSNYAIRIPEWNPSMNFVFRNFPYCGALEMEFPSLNFRHAKSYWKHSLYKHHGQHF